MADKTKVHTIYKRANGERVPSVTTVLGILNKPALLDWAWKLGQQGLDYKAVRDQAGDIGTLAHYLIMCYLKDQKPDTSEYSAQDLDKANICLMKFWEWEKGHKVETVLVETALISEAYGFGGTIDFYGRIDGYDTLLDFKTGKATYPEMFYQVAAYSQLLKEASYPLFGVRILRIGKAEEEGFEDRAINSLERQWATFQHCLAIYNLQKEMRGEALMVGECKK